LLSRLILTIAAVPLLLTGTRISTGRGRDRVTELAAFVVVPAPDDVEHRGSG
jgi:hypothetical protein